mmetsp:Transcript_24449/g.61899  ORF Transcript_24449/g.61899 Transcript_24449/m.61899 type:complete len:205 (-) Transcript_24449:332-946(-)
MPVVVLQALADGVLEVVNESEVGEKGQNVLNFHNVTLLDERDCLPNISFLGNGVLGDLEPQTLAQLLAVLGGIGICLGQFNVSELQCRVDSLLTPASQRKDPDPCLPLSLSRAEPHAIIQVQGPPTATTVLLQEPDEALFIGLLRVEGCEVFEHDRVRAAQVLDAVLKVANGLVRLVPWRVVRRVIPDKGGNEFPGVQEGGIRL